MRGDRWPWHSTRAPRGDWQEPPRLIRARPPGPPRLPLQKRPQGLGLTVSVAGHRRLTLPQPPSCHRSPVQPWSPKLLLCLLLTLPACPHHPSARTVLTGLSGSCWPLTWTHNLLGALVRLSTEGGHREGTRHSRTLLSS